VEAAKLVGLQAAVPKSPPRPLALALVSRSSFPLPDRIYPWLCALLQDRRLPHEIQLEAAAAVLRSFGNGGNAQEEEILEALTAGTGQGKASWRVPGGGGKGARGAGPAGAWGPRGRTACAGAPA